MKSTITIAELREYCSKMRCRECKYSDWCVKSLTLGPMHYTDKVVQKAIDKLPLYEKRYID